MQFKWNTAWHQIQYLTRTCMQGCKTSFPRWPWSESQAVWWKMQSTVSWLYIRERAAAARAQFDLCQPTFIYETEMFNICMGLIQGVMIHISVHAVWLAILMPIYKVLEMRWSYYYTYRCYLFEIMSVMFFYCIIQKNSQFVVQLKQNI